MDKNILKNDLIDPKKWHVILIFLFSILSLCMLWIGFQQYTAINNFFATPTVKSQRKTSFEAGDILLNRIEMPAQSSNQTTQPKLYASVKNLDHPTPDVQKKAIASQHRMDKQPVYGLAGTPSFVIKPSEIHFWRSQLYLEILVNYGGLFLISLIYIVIYEFRYRRSALFITPIKNSILTVAFLLMAGMFIKWGLNYRLVHFLNSHFYISHLQSRLPSSLYYIAVPVFILGIGLDQAVRLQKEQDLTI